MAMQTNADAVVLTVGGSVGMDRFELVFPMVDVNSSHGGTDGMCENAVTGFRTGPLPELIDCMSADVQILYVEAVGMLPGAVPFRYGYSPGDLVGARAADCLPISVGGIVTYYPASSDGSPGNRVVRGLNIICGIAEADSISGYLTATIVGLLGDFMNHLINGVTSDTALWKRAVTVRHGVGQEVRLAIKGVVRDYIGHVRKRLLPH